MLELDKTARHPHNELCRLSSDGNILENPQLVIGIGRLFVTTKNRKAINAGYTSRWTGYEVFVDRNLAAWIVFDRNSINPRAVDWYPTPCKLLPSNPKEHFDIATLFNSLHSLGDDEFSTASEKVQNTKRLVGNIMVCQVDRRDAEQLLKTAPDLDNISNSIWSAVGYQNKNIQQLANILAPYKEDYSMIENAINHKIVAEAVRNGECGEQMVDLFLNLFEGKVRQMISPVVIREAALNEKSGLQIITKFLDKDLFKDKVRESISPVVLKAAADNRSCGTLIMSKFLEDFKDEVAKNFDIDVIHAASLNRVNGRTILELLIKADKNRFSQLISTILSIHKRDWTEADLQELIKLLRDETSVGSSTC